MERETLAEEVLMQYQKPMCLAVSPAAHVLPGVGSELRPLSTQSGLQHIPTILLGAAQSPPYLASQLS